MLNHPEASTARSTGSARSVALFLPFMGQGGVERVMLNLAEGMAFRGISVTLIIATKATGPYSSQVPSEVRLVELGASRPLSSLPALVRFLRRERPDALIAALTPANVVAVIARAIARVDTRIIVGVHISVGSRVSTSPLRAVLRPLVYRTLYSQADVVLAPSHEIANELTGLGVSRQKVAVAYNPVVTPRLFALAEEKPDHPWFVGGDRPVILGIGRLHKQKDFATLLRAFSLVLEHRDARLVILGEGEEREQLEALAQELGISSRTSLPGFKENPYPFIRNSRVLVLSSAWEGPSLVLPEAMALGTPVIATRVPGGSVEILGGGRWGSLVIPGDPSALAAAMLDVLSKPPDESALRHRAWAFSVEAVIPGYLALAGFSDPQGSVGRPNE